MGNDDFEQIFTFLEGGREGRGGLDV